MTNKNPYTRKQTYSIQDVLSKVELFHTKKDVADFDGDLMKLGSDRYKCFKASGTVCVCCGLEASFFAKERVTKDQSEAWHFNLYGIKDGKEVMFTKDHVKPRILGGKDHVDNYQTMCQDCNEEKGSLYKGTDITAKSPESLMVMLGVYNCNSHHLNKVREFMERGGTDPVELLTSLRNWNRNEGKWTDEDLNVTKRWINLEIKATEA